MADNFSSIQKGMTSPADDYSAVTPSDSTDLASRPRGLYVGTGGDVVIVNPSGTAVTFKSVPSGTVLPVRAVRVKSTGTTATDIVALY